MPARKTVELAKLIDAANFFLAAPDAQVAHEYRHGGEQEIALAAGAKRRAVASFLEIALTEANAYAGFRYLASTDDVQAGNYDDSRRAYSVHHSIRCGR